MAFFADFYWGLRKIIRNSAQFLEETDEDMEKREWEEERKLVRMINKERKRRGIEGKFVPPVIQTGEEEGSLGSEEEGEGVSSDVKRDAEGRSGKEGSDNDHDGVSSEDESGPWPTTSVRSLYPHQKSKTAKPSPSRFVSSQDVAQTEDSAPVSTPVPAPKRRGRPRKSNPNSLALSEAISASLPSAARTAKKTRSEESKQNPGESVNVVDESDGPPLRPKKKGSGRPRKGIVVSDADADPVRVDEGHDDSHLRSAATNELSQSADGGLGEDAPANSVVHEPILNSMSESVPTPAPLPDVSSTADTDARSVKKSVKLKRREKDERELVQKKNTVGACVDTANIIDSGSGKRTGRTKSRTADEVPAEIMGNIHSYFFPRKRP